MKLEAVFFETLGSDFFIDIFGSTFFVNVNFGILKEYLNLTKEGRSKEKIIPTKPVKKIKITKYLFNKKLLRRIPGTPQIKSFPKMFI
jgi:hypothetical protein